MTFLRFLIAIPIVLTFAGIQLPLPVVFGLALASVSLAAFPSLSIVTSPIVAGGLPNPSLREWFVQFDAGLLGLAPNQMALEIALGVLLGSVIGAVFLVPRLIGGFIDQLLFDGGAASPRDENNREQRLITMVLLLLALQFLLTPTVLNRVLHHVSPLFGDAQRIAQPSLLFDFIRNAFTASVFAVLPFCLLAIFGAIATAVVNRTATSFANRGTLAAVRIPLLVIALVFSLGAIQRSIDDSIERFPQAGAQHG